jgi:hypothetical protein
MNTPPLYIVDIIGEVVKAVDAVLYPTLNKHILYEYGRSIQILQQLRQLNDSITQKNTKYPLVALFQPFPEDSNTDYYASVKFPKITIATLTQSTDPVSKRYDKTFKAILYPIYQEFLRQLVKHKNIVANDPGAISHKHWDVPGSEPASDQIKGANFNDIVDSIIIQDLQLTFKQIKKCKT